jgi:hypothetical protein
VSEASPALLAANNAQRRVAPMKYAGLTDDPDRRRREHGNPVDWRQWSFETREEALEWKRGILSQDDYVGGDDGDEWRHGFTYTITSTTYEPGE